MPILKVLQVLHYLFIALQRHSAIFGSSYIVSSHLCFSYCALEPFTLLFSVTQSDSYFTFFYSHTKLQAHLNMSRPINVFSGTKVPFIYQFPLSLLGIYYLIDSSFLSTFGLGFYTVPYSLCLQLQHIREECLSLYMYFG